MADVLKNKDEVGHILVQVMWRYNRQKGLGTVDVFDRQTYIIEYDVITFVRLFWEFSCVLGAGWFETTKKKSCWIDCATEWGGFGHSSSGYSH